TLTAQTDADANPQVDVSGTGTQGVLTASPSPLDFGGVLVNESDTQPVTITNTGNDSVINIQAGISGNSAFTVPSTDCSSLAQGATCEVRVQFSPTQKDVLVSGTLTVSGDAPDATGTSPSPISVTLSGSG